MVNQRLWGPALPGPEEVLRRLGAMQSQEFAVAKWSVAQRADGVTEQAMAREFANGTILRTHVLRPTWHFVLAKDIRWMLELTAPRINALNAYYYRKFGLDEDVFAKTNGIFERVLSGDRHLTRTELAAELERAGIEASGLQLGYILMRAEIDAVLCSGAPSGRQQTYALLAERVPKTRHVAREKALADLTLRYFSSRGPATLKDFVQWSSLTAADGKAGLAMVRSELDSTVVDGRTYWYPPDLPEADRSGPVIDLVQGYDEVVMSYSESKDVLHGTGGALGDTPLLHAILLDGQVIGHWKPVHKSRSVQVQTQWYRKLSAAERTAFTAALDRFADYHGVTAAAD
jgi:hypothetical protein